MRKAIALVLVVAAVAVGCRSEEAVESGQSEADSPAPTTADGSTQPLTPQDITVDQPVRLLTPSLQFEGVTYYLAWSENSGLPEHLKIAFTCTLNADGRDFSDAALHLLRLKNGRSSEVLQAVALPPRGAYWLGDVDGDGRDELFTTDTLFEPAEGLKVRQVPANPRLSYSDGTEFLKFNGGGTADILIFNLTGDIRQLLKVSGGVGISGYGILASADTPSMICDVLSSTRWADLYGTGRPVLCKISTTATWPADKPDLKTYSSHLVSYWKAPADAEDWKEINVKRRLPEGDLMQALQGILAGDSADQSTSD